MSPIFCTADSPPLTALASLLGSAVSAYESLSADLRAEGPLAPGGTDGSVLGEIAEFRERHQALHSPYLNNESHLRLERELDERAPSWYFAIRTSKRLVGVLKVRCGAFEFAHLGDVLFQHARSFQRYAEYSRLLVCATVRDRHAGRILVGRASLWLLTNGLAEGIVALCRPDLARVFQLYGLQPQLLEPTLVPARGHGIYQLMAGNWPMILSQLSTHPLAARRLPLPSSS